MLGGSIADRLGRARVFKFGLALFTAASLACSLAPGVGWLIAFRVLQGAAGAMLNPVAMSIIRNTFEDPRERAQAIGIWGAVVGISMALGPVLGGVLVGLSWRAVFLVNIPIGLAAIALTARFVPESRAPRPRRPDPVGQVLVILTLASLTSAIIEGPRLGWGSPDHRARRHRGRLARGARALRAARVDPLIEPRFFASRPFSAAAVIAIAAFAAFGGFLFLNTLYLQEVRGLSPLSAGLCTLPLAAMTVVVSPIAGRVVGTRGVRGPLVVGGLAVSAGSLMLVSLSADTSLGWLLLAYSVFGLGFGAVNPPITNAAVSGMPASQAGVAAAVATTSRQIGLTLGVAVVGAVATAQVDGSLQDQLATASHTAWWLIAALGAGSRHWAWPPAPPRPGPARSGPPCACTRRRRPRDERGGHRPRTSRLALDVGRRARPRPQGRGIGGAWRELGARARAATPGRSAVHAERARRATGGRPALRDADRRRPGGARAGATDAASRGPARQAGGADRGRPRRRRARRRDPRRAAGRPARRARRGPRGPAARARAAGRL